MRVIFGVMMLVGGVGLLYAAVLNARGVPRPVEQPVREATFLGLLVGMGALLVVAGAVTV